MVKIKKINLFVRTEKTGLKSYIYDCSSQIGFIRIVSKCKLTPNKTKKNLIVIKNCDLITELNVKENVEYYNHKIILGFSAKDESIVEYQNNMKSYIKRKK